MTTKRNKKNLSLAITPWETKYNGPAIYALVDENGGIYVGQAKRLQNRLNTHRRRLNKAITTERDNWELLEGNKLLDAARDGVVFRVEVLKRIRPEEATINIMRYWERYYIRKYKGRKIYNTDVVPFPVYNYKPNNIPYAKK